MSVASPTHEKDYDAGGKRLACRGTVYQKEKGALMGSSWNKKYAYVDEFKLLVWKTDKPSKKSSKEFEATNPRCGFIVEECIFAESSERRYAFTITDSQTYQTILLAAEDARQYEAWHEMVSRRRIQVIVSQQRQARDRDVQAKKDDEQRKLDLRTRDADLTREFFRKKDMVASDINPAIDAQHVQHLMSLLDRNIPEHAARVALREMGIDAKTGSITLAEFGQWWKAYCLETNGAAVAAAPASEQPDPPKRASTASTAAAADASVALTKTAVRFDASHSLHFSSFLDAELKTSRALRADILSAPLPNARHAPIPDPVILESDNWNDVYQRLVEQASAAFVLLPYVTREQQQYEQARQADVRHREAAMQAKAGRRSKDGKATAAVMPPSSVAATEGFEMHYRAQEMTLVDSVAACRALGKFQGEFLSTAVAGARLIIDEYVLPAEEKTKGVIILNTGSLQEGLRRAFDRALRVGEAHEADGGEDSDAPPVEEVYGYGGLLYRIAAVTATEQDAHPSAERGRYLAGADELFHKLAGNEHRHLLCVQSAVARAHRDYSRDALAAHEEDAIWVDRDDHAAEPAPIKSRGAKNDPYPPRPPKDATLKLYPHHAKDALAQGHKFHYPCTLLSAVIDYGGFRITALCPTNIDEASTLVHGFAPAGGVFVNAYPDGVAPMLNRVASQLNVSLERRVMNAVPSLGRHPDDWGAQCEPLSPEPCEVDILSREIQIHDCRDVDQRLYLINLRGVMPSDLPRRDTNDLLTHSLRPEFVASLGAPLVPEALRSVNEDALGDDGEERFAADSAGFADEYMSPAAHDVMGACAHLYTSCLPALAYALDELTVLPIDSYTLSKCFHLHGASMRQMGIIYSLCSHVFCQQTLMAEAVARCCKVLLRKALRERWRRSKAASLIASMRQKVQPLSPTT